MLRKKQSNTYPAFTLLELMITITVIAVLAGIITLAFTTTQKSTRDSARDAQVRILTDALEKYYRTNGEYPSVALMTSSDVDVVKTRLGITDASVFRFPLVTPATTNSITTASPSTTQIQYNASTTDTTKNTQCQTDLNGYCDAFELKYVKEVGAELVVAKSLHNTFVAVQEGQAPQGSINYSDDFTGTGGLGNVKSGTPVRAWDYVNSTSSQWSRNSGGYASSTVGASSNPMTVVNVASADVSITEGVRTTGNAIYFRVVDGDDWLRARVNETQTSTYVSSGYYSTYTEYEYTGTCNWYSSNSGTSGSYTMTTWATSTPSSSCAESEQSSGTISWSATGNSRQVQGAWVDTSHYEYSYNYFLILDKSVAGAVTQLGSVSLGSTQPNYIKVIAKGNSLKTFYGAGSDTTSAGSTVTDATNQSAMKHGVGYASSSYGSPTGVKSFAITDAP